MIPGVAGSNPVFLPKFSSFDYGFQHLSFNGVKNDVGFLKSFEQWVVSSMVEQLTLNQ